MPAIVKTFAQPFLRLTAIALIALSLISCATKSNRVYVGQCSVDGHWFCGKEYEKFGDCNRGRMQHDYETAGSGTCQ